MIQVGYNFNEYIALEGRFSQTLGDLSIDHAPDGGDLSNIALYVKPQYMVGDRFTLYGLLGYGQVTFDSGISDQSEDGFQYGAGISMMATDSIGLYVDYTRLYDDDNFETVRHKDITVDAVNIGLYYSF
jgi:opacity protein-like surface antigen